MRDGQHRHGRDARDHGHDRDGRGAHGHGHGRARDRDGRDRLWSQRDRSQTIQHSSRSDASIIYKNV